MSKIYQNLSQSVLRHCYSIRINIRFFQKKPVYRKFNAFSRNLEIPSTLTPNRRVSQRKSIKIRLKEKAVPSQKNENQQF